MKITRIAMLVAAAGAALLATACGGDERAGGWDGQSISASAANAPVRPQVLNSNLGLGTNRVAIGLFSAEGGLITDAEVTVHLYRLAAEPDAEPDVAEEAGEVSLTPRTLDLHPDHLSRFFPPSSDDARRAASALPALTLPATIVAHENDLTTVFVGNVDFDRTGWWGLDLDVTVAGERHEGLRVRAFVSEHTSEPAIGDPAPASRQATLADAPVEAISSATEPIPAMLEYTIADAIETGKPVVVAFVTPAFCQTRFCGPVLEAVVVPAYEQYRDRVVFVHVEPYVLETARTQGVLEPVPAVLEWGLRAEPILFVIGKDGRIAAKFEGVVEVTELTDAIEATLQ